MNFIKKQFPALLLIVPFFLVTASIAFAESSWISDTLWALVVNLFGRLMMGFGGLLLDSGVNSFVIGFGDRFLDTGVGFAVDTLWVSVRDIFNLTFIFGLVYIGFKMILNSDDSNTRRWLVHLILAAILINFSLYITKFVVDFSNILATQIASGFVNPLNDKVEVSNTFMNQLGLNGTFALPDDVVKGDNSPYGYIFGSAFLFIISAFVFGAGGILLIVRYAVLCLYMVLSPLMFLGWVFPGLQSLSTKYWKGFLGRAFFAPFYLLFLYFGATVINSFYGSGGKANYAETLGGDGNVTLANFENTIPPFILACVFMVAALVVANKMGADGASQAINLGRNISGRARKRVQNAAVWGAKTAVSPVTAGAGAIAKHSSNAIGNSLNTTVDRWQRGQGFGANGLIRAASNTVVADSAMRGAATKMKGVKAGRPNTVDEDQVKKGIINKRNDDYVKQQAAKAAQKENDRYDRDTQAILPGTNQVVDRKSIINPAILEKIEKEEQARDATIAEAQGVMNDLSQKELESMFVNDNEMFNQVIGQVKSGTFDKLMASENLTSAQKGDMVKRRQEAIKSTFKKGEAVLSENIQNLSIKQIETMGDQFIRDNAHLFSTSQMESINKSENFVEGQKGAYIKARKDKQKAMARNANESDRLFKHNTSANPGTYDKTKKAVDVANLPFEVFIDSAGVNVDTIKQLDGSALEEIFAKKTMTVEQRGQLRDAIRDTHGSSSDAIRYLDSAHGVRNWG